MGSDPGCALSMVGLSAEADDGPAHWSLGGAANRGCLRLDCGYIHHSSCIRDSQALAGVGETCERGVSRFAELSQMPRKIGDQRLRR